MATATVTGLTLINEVENTTGLVSIGGGPGASLTDDIFIQGTSAVGRRGATGGRGFGYNISPIDFTIPDRQLWIWVNIALGPDGLDTLANGGLSIRVGSSTGGTANFKDFHVGGGDVTVAGWKRYCIDLNKTASGSSGTPDMSNVQFIGVFTRWLTVPGGNIPHYVIDAFHYGAPLTVTGGDSGDRLTWSDIVAYTEDPSRMWGVLERRGGVLFANGDITLGDGTGTGSCWLEDQDQIIEFQEQRYYEGGVVTSVPDDFQGISVAGNSTGTTNITDGSKIGTGDDMAGSNGSVIQMEPGATTLMHINMSHPEVEFIGLYGTSIRRSRDEVSFSDDPTNGPNHELAGMSVDGSTQVNLGRVVARNSVFQGYTGADAALLWNPNIDVKFSAFRNNSYGIEHAAEGTFTYEGLTFAGNTFDINFSGTGDLVINAVAGSNVSTYEITGAGDSVTIDNPVQITLINLQPDTEVRVYFDDNGFNGDEIAGVEDSGTTFAFSTQGNTIINIMINHLFFLPADIWQLNSGTADSTIPISQFPDRSYAPGGS